MNGKMWLHPATQENVAALKARGAEFIGPEEGLLSCGYEGLGRLWPVEAVALARPWNCFLSAVAKGREPTAMAMNTLRWHKPKWLPRLLAEPVPDPSQHATRILAIQRNIVLPVKLLLMIVVFYYLFPRGGRGRG